MVLDWRFDGDAAGGVLDASGYGHHGKFFGAITRVTDGDRTVLELDGKSHIWPLQTPGLALEPPYTMVYDLSPEAAGNVELFSASFQFGMSLEFSTAGYRLLYRNAGGKPFYSKPCIVPAGMNTALCAV